MMPMTTSSSTSVNAEREFLDFTGRSSTITPLVSKWDGHDAGTRGAPRCRRPVTSATYVLALMDVSGRLLFCANHSPICVTRPKSQVFGAADVPAWYGFA